MKRQHSGMKPSLAGLELLFAEYQAKLSAYTARAAIEFYWTLNPDVKVEHNHQPRIKTSARQQWWFARGVFRERERRGLEVHKLHVDAYHAGEMYRAALRMLVA